MNPPPTVRPRDWVAGVLLLLLMPNPLRMHNNALVAFQFLLMMWMAALAFRSWWRYRQETLPLARAFALTKSLQAQWQSVLGEGYQFQPLPADGVRLSSPYGPIYHLYPLNPEYVVVPGQWVSTSQQLHLAGQEAARILHVDSRAGETLVQGDEVILHGGLEHAVEQISFWEKPVAQEYVIRQQGREVESKALAALDRTFSGWSIQKGLLMRYGGDVDALLTRPDGKVFSVEIKSHRGPPDLKEGVLHFGRDEKAGVQEQLHLQARETNGQAVCWQPRAGYGIKWIDGVLFVGGKAQLLREVLGETAAQ